MTFIYGSAAGGSYLRNISSPGSIPVDRDYSADWRNGICDVQGRFKFEEVPEGRWFVVTTVYWQVPSGSPYVPASTQGGPIMRPVEVFEGKTVTATVSP